MWKELVKGLGNEKGGRRGRTQPRPPPLGLQAPEGRRICWKSGTALLLFVKVGKTGLRGMWGHHTLRKSLSSPSGAALGAQTMQSSEVPAGRMRAAAEAIEC